MITTPREAAVTTALPDGTPVWMWPLLPTDRQGLAEEFEKLSPESRRYRFLTPMMHLTDEMLHHLVDDVDGVDHIALVLSVEVGEELEPVAIGRIVRYPQIYDTADIAVTVKDAWQGRGIATVLLHHLVEVRPVGVTKLLTEVVASNTASLAMLRRLGETETEDIGHGIVDVRVKLFAAEHHQETTQIDPTEVPRQSQKLQTRDLVCPWLAPTQKKHKLSKKKPGESSGEKQKQSQDSLR